MKEVLAAILGILPARTARYAIVALLLGTYLYSMDRRVTAIDSKIDRQAQVQETATSLLSVQVKLQTEATQDLAYEVRQLRELLAQRALDRPLDRPRK